MNKYKNITESTLLKVGQGVVKAIIVNSHTSGTIKLIDGLSDGVLASGTLTSSGASAPADYAVGTLTSDATNVADDETVVVGATGGTAITYRFKDTPAQAYDVQIGASASASLDNLKATINGTGTAGTEYYAGTLANPDIIAYTKTATTLKVGFRTIGTDGNAYTTTETSGHLSWGAGTLAGGVVTTAATLTIGNRTYTATKTLAETLGLPSVADQILWVTSEAVFLDNIKSAVNGSGVRGTDYSTATSPHQQVKATTNAATTQAFVANEIGTSGNSIATTETLDNYAFGAATLASGTGLTGKIITNTVTLGTVTAGIDRNLQLDDMAFSTGLLVILGGTADITVVYN
jgi:hypothetical protein